MDKSHINMAGRLQMEPISISQRPLKHTVHRQAIAMRILGYISHSAPAHFPALSELHTMFNAPSGLPHRTVVVEASLRRIKNVTWPTYLLNKSQIPSCNCSGRASNGIYTTMQRYIQLCFTGMYHLSLGHRGAQPSLRALHGTFFKDTTTLLYL
jgi:hypothetical protein